MKHLEFIEQAKYDYETFDDQRDQAEEDIRFCLATGGQWDNWSPYIDARFNGRAKLEFDFTTQGLNRHMAEWSANRKDVLFSPDDDKTTDEDAELMNGIYRRDYRMGGGRIAVDNAKLMQAMSGCGAIHLGEVYENEEDPDDTRQRITFNPIHSAHSTVIWDAGAKLIDKSDANHVSWIEEFDKKTLERDYPNEDDLSTTFGPSGLKIWRRNDAKKSIHIMTRFEKKKAKKEVYVYINDSTGLKEFVNVEDDDLLRPELEADGYELAHKKKIIRQWVEKSIIHGGGFLQKPTKIAGKHIPIIPFYAYYGYSEGREYYYGLIRKQKDPQRLINMQVSTLAEVAGTRPNRIPMIDPQAIEGYTDIWNSNINDKNWLPIRPDIDEDGTVHPPFHGQLEPPVLDPNTAALVEFTSSYMQNRSGGQFDEIKDNEMSGKAIRQLVKRANMDAKPVDDNALVALRRVGVVYQSKAQEIYKGRRSIKTIAEDGSEKIVQLNKPMADEQTGEIVKSNNISAGNFECVVEVGPGYDTLHEEAIENIRGVMADVPPDSPYYDVLLASLVEAMGQGGFTQLKDFARKQMLKTGLKEPETPDDKAFLEQASQPGVEEEMAKAASEQALADAKRSQAGAVKDMAQAKKYIAETQEIYSDIGLNQTEANAVPLQNRKAELDRMRSAMRLH